MLVTWVCVQGQRSSMEVDEIEVRSGPGGSADDLRITRADDDGIIIESRVTGAQLTVRSLSGRRIGVAVE